ncbi:hypothetical protein PRUPE_5G026600 [Prunus persica]|uniref:Uncharacterized protein n=1 Tax=Prunus persica TaxID=3760 RepID=A0A251P2T0_PRUPE|nr:hypothetical protein PRUPE_5G026600 [Prunus persica]
MNLPPSYKSRRPQHFLHRWMKMEQSNFWLTMVPEKEYNRETTSITRVAIHTKLFQIYVSNGTQSSRLTLVKIG